MKIHVITMAKTFQKGHPRHGENTNFKDKLLSGEKIHTIRKNIEYWQEIIDDVNSGTHYLSVREWVDLPYKSKQAEIKRYYKLGSELVKFNNFEFYDFIRKGIQKNSFITLISKNDGLNLEDFVGWFPEGITGIIIHFTDFRYEKI